MVDFWLNNIQDLFSPKNFESANLTQQQKKVQILNIIALTALILSLYFSYRKKNSKYFAMGFGVMAFTIVLNRQTNVNSPRSGFTNISSTILDTAFDTGSRILENANKGTNLLYINQTTNINRNDVIALSINDKILETNIVSDIKSTTNNNLPVLMLVNPLKTNYPSGITKILKVSDSSPDIIPPPDGNVSIQRAGNTGTSDPLQMAASRHPKFNLPNQNRYDWNLEQSGMVPGGENNYVYQGQPYGNLTCRGSTQANPMGNINVTEYDQAPTMYGTCNVAETTDGVYNDTLMTRNQESTVSQRVDDLLFHRGNSQMMFSPMPADTLPNNQNAFANWCYNTPANGVNVKYASIFVNDPEKYKLISRLAKATGTENGGGR